MVDLILMALSLFGVRGSAAGSNSCRCQRHDNYLDAVTGKHGTEPAGLAAGAEFGRPGFDLQVASESQPSVFSSWNPMLACGFESEAENLNILLTKERERAARVADSLQ